MNRTNIIAIVVLIALILIGTGSYLVWQNQKRLEEVNIEPASLPTPTTNFPASTPSASAQNGTSINRQPDAGTGNKVIKKLGITIIEPQEGSFASSPLIIRGYANVFGGLVQLKLKDTSGETLGTTTAMGCTGEEACPFEVPLIFSKSQTASGTLETFSNSAKDGSVENLVTVPVTF
ncbi:hypothetical protein HY382_00860 [Candidatus Curtissbacteria bacterium]|nr:hypothetical protein [Candidatus Curtissbacteria bacterium]